MIAFATEMMTSPGGREVNEDRCNFLSLNGAVCWIVADGLGGQGGGEVASQVAADTVLSSFGGAPRVAPEVLQAALEAANNAVIEEQKREPRLAGMRTTAVILLADARQSLWAHIGDSRLYHFRGGRIIAQTRDHSVPQAMADAGEISPRQIRYHEDRSRLLRSLGGQDNFRPAIIESPATLAPGDAFLLATDGFWEYITETEMEAELAKAAAPADWLQRMETRIHRKAPVDSDNYTAIGVFVLDQPSPGGVA